MDSGKLFSKYVIADQKDVLKLYNLFYNESEFFLIRKEKRMREVFEYFKK